MKIFYLASVVGFLIMASGNPSLQAMELGPEMHMDDGAKGPSTDDSLNTGSTCNRSDQVVFSCPPGDGSKMVSMCDGGDAASGHRRFYYAYGRPGSPELTYPSPNQVNGEFTRTRLGLTGNRGGYAYAFTDSGYKYVVYATAGERKGPDGGVIVQRVGQPRAVAKMTCQSGKVPEAK